MRRVSSPPQSVCHLRSPLPSVVPTESSNTFATHLSKIAGTHKDQNGPHVFLGYVHFLGTEWTRASTTSNNLNVKDIASLSHLKRLHTVGFHLCSIFEMTESQKWRTSA